MYYALDPPMLGVTSVHTLIAADKQQQSGRKTADTKLNRRTVTKVCKQGSVGTLIMNAQAVRPVQGARRAVSTPLDAVQGCTATLRSPWVVSYLATLPAVSGRGAQTPVRSPVASRC